MFPDLIDRLTKLGREAAESIDYLNSGGCGVYAALVGRQLKVLKCRPQVIVGCWDNQNLSEIRQGISKQKRRSGQAWREAGIVCDHVLVTFRHKGTTWTHDSTRTRPGIPELEWTCGSPICEGRLTVAELQAIANYPYGWNNAFPRRTGARLIARLVSEYLGT